SAFYTNNHLEAFELLKNIDLGKKKIICPLSYGNRNYAKKIADKGKKRWKDNFVPLFKLMPLHEYNEYLRLCGIVIMNNYRQQAVGNILTMIWMGAKVFLNEETSLYKYLKRIGVFVFSISTDLDRDN